MYLYIHIEEKGMDRYSKYNNMFNTPEDRLKEREALSKYYRKTIQKATLLVVQSGVQGHSHLHPRSMKHKSFTVSGVKVR